MARYKTIFDVLEANLTCKNVYGIFHSIKYHYSIQRGNFHSLVKPSVCNGYLNYWYIGGKEVPLTICSRLHVLNRILGQ